MCQTNLVVVVGTEYNQAFDRLIAETYPDSYQKRQKWLQRKQVISIILKNFLQSPITNVLSRCYKTAITTKLAHNKIYNLDDLARIMADNPPVELKDFSDVFEIIKYFLLKAFDLKQLPVLANTHIIRYRIQDSQGVLALVYQDNVWENYLDNSQVQVNDIQTIYLHRLIKLSPNGPRKDKMIKRLLNLRKLDIYQIPEMEKKAFNVLNKNRLLINKSNLFR